MGGNPVLARLPEGGRQFRLDEAGGQCVDAANGDTDGQIMPQWQDLGVPLRPRLFHFSEDPAIESFAPKSVDVPTERLAGEEWLNGPLVWAVSEGKQATYLFPENALELSSGVLPRPPPRIPRPPPRIGSNDTGFDQVLGS